MPDGLRADRRAAWSVRMGSGVYRTSVVEALLLVLLYVVALVMLLHIGPHISLPDEGQANGMSRGALNAATRELVGRGDPTDFLVDYASVHGSPTEEMPTE
jgi:hypothetical protein